MSETSMFYIKEKTAYKCELCGGWFVPSNLRCGVIHPAGTCCHYGEVRISD